NHPNSTLEVYHYNVVDGVNVPYLTPCKGNCGGETMRQQRGSAWRNPFGRIVPPVRHCGRLYRGETSGARLCLIVDLWFAGCLARMCNYTQPRARTASATRLTATR